MLPPDAGSIDIDTDVYRELAGTGIFKTMNLRADEVRNVVHVLEGSLHGLVGESGSLTDEIAVQAEHSLELHMPFIVHAFRQVHVFGSTGHPHGIHPQ
jgi:predicted class III extradiol MEMO1 family dioxygenase